MGGRASKEKKKEKKEGVKDPAVQTYKWEEVLELNPTLSQLTRDRSHFKYYCEGNCPCGCTTPGHLAHTHWSGALHDRVLREYKYFCPSGWFRYSLNIAGADCFTPDWLLMYHGTKLNNVVPIVTGGFKARECQHGVPAVYFSPCISYCAHPRYSRVYHRDREVFYQFALEVRINTKKVKTARKRETLSVGDSGCIDENYPGNEGLEFVICCEKEGQRITGKQGAIVTAIMCRKLEVDPLELAQSWWWTRWRHSETIRSWYYVPKIGEVNEKEDY